MFIHRTARFGLGRVFGLVHIFLACVSLPPADAGPHSVKLANHSESSRRSPSLSFRIIEENHHDGPPVGARSFSQRNSHHRAAEKEENYVPRRGPVSSRRRDHHRRTGVKDNQSRDMSTNVNSNAARTNQLYMDGIPFSDMDDSDDVIVDDSSTVKLEAKLYGSYKFGVNIIKVFGQILKAPNNRLTVDQFTSLNLILEALVHKQVYIFNLLPILKKLQGADKETQFKLVLQALANDVPMYIVSACTFWLGEIEHHYVNVDELIGSIAQPHDFLAGISPKVIDICIVKVAAEEMEPFDELSEITKKTLGLVFVKIFNRLKNHELILSQKLFGAILINLPIGKLDPVLGEYINYIWDVVQDNLLPNWDIVAPEIEYGSPYQLVKSVATMLLTKGNLSDVLKHAFKYLLMHLKEVPNSFADEHYQDMQILLNNEKNVKLMFSMILDDLYIPELSELRDQMIAYMNQTNMDEILQGMNMYAYEKPIDLLIALLVRIESRTQGEDIGSTASKLLSILISEKEFGSFTVTVSSDVDLVMLLGFLNVPDSDPSIPALAQKIQLYLEGDLDLLGNLQNLVPKTDKSKCHRPIQCLLNVLTKTVNPNTIKKLGVPSDLAGMMQTLIDLMKEAINSSVECKPHDVLSVEHPEVPDDLSDVISETTTSDKPTSSPVPLSTSTDYDEIVLKPEPPDLHSTEDIQIVYPTLVATTEAPQTSSSEKPVLTTQKPSDVAPLTENHPLLPPNFNYNQSLYVVFPENDLPPYTSLTKPTSIPDSKSYVKLPSIKELLQELDSKVLSDPDKLPDIPDLIDPLKKLLGPDFIEQLLGKHVNETKYPTLISLMDDVLDHALENPKVKADLTLTLHIKMCLKAIEYIGLTALFPVIVDVQKIESDIIHVTFDPDNFNMNSIDTSPPERIPAGFFTLAVYHPKYWVKSVNFLSPYATLLPMLNDVEDNPIQELMDNGTLKDSLGPKFDPLFHPNQGTLLFAVLQKLIVSQRVQADLSLLKKLDAYLKGIKAVAFYNKIPKSYGTHMLDMQLDNQKNWHPDITDLDLALPPPFNHHEFHKYRLIKDFLHTTNLLELLKMESPPYFITRGEFLKMIFETAIRGENMILDQKLLDALKYYKSKILTSGDGAMPINWVWVEMFIIREEVPLGEIIEAVIDYDSLPYELRISYNNLMTYLSENPQFLQGDESFPFERYPTKGTFLTGLFKHFLTKPNMSQAAKKYINELIPHIRLTGPGAEVIKHATIDDIANRDIDKHEVSILLNGQ